MKTWHAIHREFFQHKKIKITCTEKNLIILIFLLKILIVGTCCNHLTEAVLTSNHNRLFWIKNKKFMYTPVYPQF